MRGLGLATPASRGESIAYGAGGGALLGVVVGSLVGLKTHEDWERVSITPQMAWWGESGARVHIVLAY